MIKKSKNLENNKNRNNKNKTFLEQSLLINLIKVIDHSNIKLIKKNYNVNNKNDKIIEYDIIFSRFFYFIPNSISFNFMNLTII